LADRVIIADTLRTRLKGLLGYRAMPANTVMLIAACDQVHMFFMRFGIGVIFLDKNNKVLDTQCLAPWQVSKKVPGAISVLETGLEVLDLVKRGDIIKIS